jgi:hypothetical protein
VWTLEECEVRPRILIRDNDKKFIGAHDLVFRSEGVRVVRTPIQAPNANTYAERWIRTVREECLNHLLILNEKHLRRVLQAFIEYYNTARPHQGFPGNQTTRAVRSVAKMYSVSSATTTAALIRLPSARSERSLRGIPPLRSLNLLQGLLRPAWVSRSCTSRRTNSRRNAQGPSQKRSRWTGFPRCRCAIPVPRTPLALFFAFNSTWMRFLHHTPSLMKESLCFSTRSHPESSVMVALYLLLLFQTR